MKWSKWIGMSMVVAAALAFGCKQQGGGEGGGENEATETSAEDHSHDGHDHGPGEEHADHSHDSDSSSHSQESAAEKIAANLAKLSEADRALAEKQKICPVSEEPLGEMGVPIKVTVKDGDQDKEVFICCKGCEKPVKEDPAKYLAKLKQ